MALSSTDVARLVHHFLLVGGFEASADTYLKECPHLASFVAVTPESRRLTRLIGPSLPEIIDEYFYVKDCIIAELQQIQCPDYRSHDSLLTLCRTLVSCLKGKEEGGSAVTATPSPLFVKSLQHRRLSNIKSTDETLRCHTSPLPIYQTPGTIAGQRVEDVSQHPESISEVFPHLIVKSEDSLFDSDACERVLPSSTSTTFQAIESTASSSRETTIDREVGVGAALQRPAKVRKKKKSKKERLIRKIMSLATAGGKSIKRRQPSPIPSSVNDESSVEIVDLVRPTESSLEMMVHLKQEPYSHLQLPDTTSLKLLQSDLGDSFSSSNQYESAMQPMVVLKDIYQGYPILFGEPTSLKLEPAMEATEIPTSSIDHT